MPDVSSNYRGKGDDLEASVVGKKECEERNSQPLCRSEAGGHGGMRAKETSRKEGLICARENKVFSATWNRVTVTAAILRLHFDVAQVLASTPCSIHANTQQG